MGVCSIRSQLDLGSLSYFYTETLFNTRLCNLILFHLIPINKIPECLFLMISWATFEI